MLVLSRRHGQRIIIETPAGNIVLVPVEVTRCGKVRLGIEAPREFNIYREEIGPLKKKPVTEGAE